MLKINYFSTKEIPIPFLADSIKDVTIIKYLVKEGDFVKQDDEVLEVESHKGSMKIRVSAAGKVTKFLCQPDSDVSIGAKYLEIDPDAVPGEQTTKQVQKNAKEDIKVQETPALKKVVAVPVKETKNNNTESESSTKNKKETSSVVENKKTETSSPKKDAPSPTVESGIGKDVFVRKETREKMSRMRRTVAERLKESQNTNAHVTTMQEIDMSEVMKIRKELGEDFQQRNGVKLGFMSFFIKAVTRGLLERPIMNSVIDGSEIIHRNFIDISVAVSSPKGLVVPVLRNTQLLTFAEIESALIELSKKASTGLLSIEEMTGGTFTISNGGVFGSMLSIPIINPPQSAVLGMHNIVNRPVVRGDQIVARPIMYISMSYDHRLLDGREGSGFLKRIADLLEDPRKMLLEV